LWLVEQAGDYATLIPHHIRDGTPADRCSVAVGKTTTGKLSPYSGPGTPLQEL
jgi:hypothetical protein